MSLTIWNFIAAGTIITGYLIARKKRLKRGLTMAVFAFVFGALVLAQIAEQKSFHAPRACGHLKIKIKPNYAIFKINRLRVMANL